MRQRWLIAGYGHAGHRGGRNSQRRLIGWPVADHRHWRSGHLIRLAFFRLSAGGALVLGVPSLLPLPAPVLAAEALALVLACGGVVLGAAAREVRARLGGDGSSGLSGCTPPGTGGRIPGGNTGRQPPTFFGLRLKTPQGESSAPGGMGASEGGPRARRDGERCASNALAVVCTSAADRALHSSRYDVGRAKPLAVLLLLGTVACTASNEREICDSSGSEAIE